MAPKREKELFESYQCFDIELGADHPDTKHARELYMTYCAGRNDAIDIVREKMRKFLSFELVEKILAELWNY